MLNDISAYSQKSGLLTARTKEDSFIKNIVFDLNKDNNQTNVKKNNYYENISRNIPKVIQQLNSVSEKVKEDGKKAIVINKLNSKVISNNVDKVTINKTSEKDLYSISIKNNPPTKRVEKYSNNIEEETIKYERNSINSLPNTINIDRREIADRTNYKRAEENVKIYASPVIKNNIQSPSHNFNLNLNKLPNSKSPLTSNQSRLNEFKNMKLNKKEVVIQKKETAKNTQI